MSDLLATLLSKIGAETASRNTKAGKLFADTEGVSEGQEMLRIRALPRRRWQDDPQLEELTDMLTERYKRMNAEDQTARLFPVQAVGLAEFELYGRLTAVWSIGPQPVDEPVLTPDGWRPIGSLQPGDSVIGSQGKPVLVKSVFDRGVQRVQKIHFNDGTWARSSENHLWTFEDIYGNPYTQPLYAWMAKPLARRGKHGALVRRWWLPKLAPVVGRFDDGSLPLDPYTLGALIGDGGLSQDTIYFTSADPDLVAALRLPDSVELVDTNSTRCGKARTYRIVKKARQFGPKANELSQILEALGCLHKRAEHKRVPECYRYNTPANRLALLQGLFDTDGNASGRLCDFTTSSPGLADDVCEMVESLGGSAKLRIRETKLNGVEKLPAFRISVQLPGEMPLFRLARKHGRDLKKRARVDAQRQRVTRSPERFEYDGDRHCVCIEVDAPDHLYVTRHHILTHNTGKTLLTGLLPTVANAKRPLLLLPAALIDKTRREFKTLSKTWRIHPGIQLFSYERISLPQYKTFLQDGRYDLVLADESHMLKNMKAGRTKRLGEFLTDNNVTFVPCTGSPGDSSISNIAHYMHWAQGENSPFPKPKSWELIQWTQALDERVRELRRAPGALVQLADGRYDLDSVREGVGRRAEETPGVVYHRHASVDCSLYVDAWVHDDYSDTIEDVFAHVRETGDEMPDGRVLESALDRYSTFATLSLGFCRYLDPPPPDDWRAARKAYRSFVNECLDDHRLGFDTPGEVTLACENHELNSCGVYESWRDIEPTFKPISKVMWFSTEILELLTQWMKDNDALVWVPFPAFGRALSKLSGRPFFHHQGISLTHGSIEAYEGACSVIASTQSNSTGRNLQRWSKNLIVGPSAKADALEQQIGRTHRTGQKADAVEVLFFIGSVENLEAIDRARARALVDKQMGRNQAHKLLACDWLLPDSADILRKHKGPRWAK